MADNGELETWKTPGGHRRIKRESVLKQLQTHYSQLEEKQPTTSNKALKIIVIDEDLTIQDAFKTFEKINNFPTQITSALNGFNGLIEAGRGKFDMIFISLNIPSMNVYEAINALRNDEVNNKTTIVIMIDDKVTELEREHLPFDVILLNKPLNLDIVKQFMVYENSLKSTKI